MEGRRPGSAERGVAGFGADALRPSPGLSAWDHLLYLEAISPSIFDISRCDIPRFTAAGKGVGPSPSCYHRLRSRVSPVEVPSVKRAKSPVGRPLRLAISRER